MTAYGSVRSTYGAINVGGESLADDRAPVLVADRGSPDEVAARLLQPERGIRRADQLRGALDDARQHVVETFRGGEVAAELEQRLRALGLAPLRLVEPCVLERDGRVAGEHLEQAQVVLVELVEAELRDDDRADHPGAVVERDGDDRLVDLRRALDLDRELALRGVRQQQRLAGLDDAAGEALADARAEDLGRGAVRRGQLALEGDRRELVAVADEDAAVVVVDQQAELVRDRHADLAHVVRAVQLAAERLEHLQVRDRADVLAVAVARLRALGRRVVEEDDLVLAARLRGHHRGLGAGDELARVRGVLGALGDPDRDGDPAREIELDVLQPLREPARQRDHVVLVARRHDHRELLAADPADDVGGADGRPQVIGEIGEHLVADGMAEDVVHLLEVVDVDHHHGDVLVRARGAGQLAPQALVEVTVVVEAGERVGLRLALEPRSDVRVVERERGGVAEPLGELELLVGERRVLADPVDVERPLQRAARDERDDDQRLRLERGAGNEAHTRVEVSLVREHRLAVLDGPAGDPLAEREALAEDLVRVLAAHERRHELALRLVRLVDVQRLVRDDLVERVGDPHEQRVEALLREQVVEDVREPAVGVDGRVGAGRRGHRRRAACAGRWREERSARVRPWRLAARAGTAGAPGGRGTCFHHPADHGSPASLVWGSLRLRRVPRSRDGRAAIRRRQTFSEPAASKTVKSARIRLLRRCSAVAW